MKAIKIKTVVIGIIASIAAALMYLLPWGKVDGDTYNVFALLKEMREQSMITLIIIPIVVFIVAAVLFLTDHPKLVLIPAIIALLMHAIDMMAFGDALTKTRGAEYLAAVPVIQLLLAILVIVMAAVSKKANPKYKKVKIEKADE